MFALSIITSSVAELLLIFDCPIRIVYASFSVLCIAQPFFLSYANSQLDSSTYSLQWVSPPQRRLMHSSHNKWKWSVTFCRKSHTWLVSVRQITFSLILPFSPHFSSRIHFVRSKAAPLVSRSLDGDVTAALTTGCSVILEFCKSVAGNLKSSGAQRGKGSWGYGVIACLQRAPSWEIPKHTGL